MKLEINTLTPEEYHKLTMEAQWEDFTLDDISIALTNSVIVFAMRINKEAVGCVRIIGDGKICCYIQDLIVLKTHRRRGIATQLMESAMEYISNNASHDCFIGLMASKGLEKFYSSFGFISRPNSHMGSGLIQFLNKNK